MNERDGTSFIRELTLLWEKNAREQDRVLGEKRKRERERKLLPSGGDERKKKRQKVRERKLVCVEISVESA